MILFRGKRVDNGEWIEGFYAKSGEKKYILIDNDIAVGYLAMKEVNPDTVGQYTGLTDKNGKRIFEGDIVSCISNTDYGNCVVIFEEGEFRLVPDRYYKTYTTGGGYHAIRCFVKEVIGNIHDSPEKLKIGATAAKF